MKKIIKKPFYFIGAVVVAVVVIASIAIKQVNPNQYKSDIEKLLNTATDFDWTIGTIDLSLTPLLTVTFKDVYIRDQKNEILRAEKVRSKSHILPLLSRHIKIRKFEIINCTAHIEKDAQGKFNFIKKSSPSPDKKALSLKLPVKSLTLHNFLIKNGTLIYSDKKTNTKNRVDNLDFKLGSFKIIKNYQLTNTLEGYFKNRGLKGKLAAKKFMANNVVIRDISSKIISKKGVLEFSPAKATFYGSVLNTSLSIDLFSKAPTIDLQGAAKNCNIEPILKAYKKEAFITGCLNTSIQLTTKGFRKEDILQNLDGNISISGTDLVFNLFDVDKVIEKYEKTQGFSMVDLGGFLILGPFSPILTKGYNASGLYRELDKKKSAITKLVNTWQIRNGIAYTSDVAVASTKNRVAAQGKLDLVQQKFDDFKVAILDTDGCVRFSQTINGPFQKPEVKKADLVTQIFKPVELAIRKSKKLLFKEKACEPFYKGKVSHPVPK